MFHPRQWPFFNLPPPLQASPAPTHATLASQAPTSTSPAFNFQIPTSTIRRKFRMKVDGPTPASASPSLASRSWIPTAAQRMRVARAIALSDLTSSSTEERGEGDEPAVLCLVTFRHASCDAGAERGALQRELTRAHRRSLWTNS
ncbi:unnamed protein product [Prorocentrum cordatum]|uniref:Uncharacterized protein n=1 Tax=Prorocentrum cordatum TaxID=2364126 RepID=A0ABN9PBT8_9DINO|nr:unnamed protein product [Polarella glacialis]